MAGISAQEFVRKWDRTTLSERASYQSHFNELCDLLNEPRPTDVDTEGSEYCFEKYVEKTGGGKGFADVWRRGRFAFEYKKKGRNLLSAYQQLAEYREALENPPVLVATDIGRYLVRTSFTGLAPQTFEFTNRDLLQPKRLETLKRAFSDPESLRRMRTPEAITLEAAESFAHLADGLRERGVEPRAASHFLNRLLFCLFAEDVKLLNNSLFTRIVERGVKNPDGFNRNIRELFRAMATGGEAILEEIPRFNGGLFDDEIPEIDLTSQELRMLLGAARLDWREVEPTIFGTLFERSLDPSQRARLGAHYTSPDDILAVVEPVLMEPLRREWADVREEVERLSGRIVAGDGTARVNRSQENTTTRRMRRGILDFLEKLRSVRVLDPACGSGNFLYVSLKELLDLEREVSAFADEKGLGFFTPEVRPEQLYGIETSPYAHELAQVVVWIGFLQWMVENGFGFEEPILGAMTNIKWMDAILAKDEDGNPKEPDWPAADVIIGNPPFLGGKRMRAELADEYVDDIFKIYEGRVPREADLVTYWFEKARNLIANGEVKRAGLISTNSIRGGKNREVLKRIRESGDIFFAFSDREWIQNGAAVRVSMVGFDDGTQTERTLDGLPAQAINSDLTGSLDLTVAARLHENADLAFMGDTKGGPFDLPPETAWAMLAKTGNPNGKPNSDVVCPWVNGLDITRRPRGFYIIDFGIDTTLEDAALYEAPFEYINEHVRPMRENSRSTRSEWWLHERPRVDMRRALDRLERFIITPRVSKYRTFAWLDGATLPDSATIAIARDDDYFFGVLHSRVHEIWSLRMCTFLGKGNDPRYTPTTCFETYPFPFVPGEEPEGDGQLEAIASAARRLDELRRNWLDPAGTTAAELKKRTLTNLYNERPTWLSNAHAELDKAVFAAYGWPRDITDDEMLANLLALNAGRSGG